MKKFVLTIALVLLLLVSCATKKTEQEQTAEVVETTVVEQLPPSVPATVVDENPPAEETATSQENPSEEASVLPEVIAPLEDIPSETETPASTDAPVTDWGYVFTSPSTEEPAKAQTTSDTAKATEVKKDVVKPAAPAVQSRSVSEPAEEGITNNSFLSKVINFIAHEKLFSLGLFVLLVSLIYFIIALVRSSGMTRSKKKKVAYREEVTHETYTSNEDVEMQDSSSSGFSTEEENDEFLRALLGEDKK
jgi:hypothetical protein